MHLDKLPIDLLTFIFSHNTRHDLDNLALVNKTFHEAACKSNPDYNAVRKIKIEHKFQAKAKAIADYEAARLAAQVCAEQAAQNNHCSFLGKTLRKPRFF